MSLDLDLSATEELPRLHRLIIKLISLISLTLKKEDTCPKVLDWFRSSNGVVEKAYEKAFPRNPRKPSRFLPGTKIKKKGREEKNC